MATKCAVIPTRTWYFDSLSDDFTLSESTGLNPAQKLQLSSNLKITNKEVLDKLEDIDGQLYYDNSPIGSGLDFGALSDALTTGTLTGITITPDITNENFDITITATMPTLTVDSDGYWVINGTTTSYQSRGSTPEIDSTTKDWFIDNIDTGVRAEGVSPTVTVTDITNGKRITITDIDSTDTFDLTNGVTTVSTTKVDLTCTAAAADWVGTSAPYSQTISVPGLTTDLNPLVDVIVDTTDLALGLEQEYQWGFVTRGVTAADSLTLYCYSQKPTIDLNLMIEVR